MSNEGELIGYPAMADDDEFQISSQYQAELEIGNLINELSGYYERPQLFGGVITNWFSRKRIESQDKKLSALLSLVGTVRNHATSLREFKQDLLAYQMEITAFLLGKKQELQFKLKEQEEIHLTAVAMEQANRDRLRYNLDSLKLDNENKKLLNERLGFENKILELKGILIDKIIKDLDWSNLDWKQMSILVEMVKDSSTLQDLLKAESELNNLMAEASMKEKEAELKAEEVKMAKMKTEKKDIYQQEFKANRGPGKRS